MQNCNELLITAIHRMSRRLSGTNNLQKLRYLILNYNHYDARFLKFCTYDIVPFFLIVVYENLDLLRATTIACDR